MKLSIDVSTAIIGWCQDAAAQYRENDPAVGIFPNEEMAEAFDGLANLVEDMADGEVGPVDGLHARVAELEAGLEACAENLELALSRLGCPTEGNDGGSHGHDADDMGGIAALGNARNLLTGCAITKMGKRIKELEDAMGTCLYALEKMSEESDCNIDPFTFGRWGGDLALKKLRALTQPKG